MTTTTHSLVRLDSSSPAPCSEVIDGQWSIPVVREIVEFPTRDGVRLLVLRKRLAGPVGGSRGAILLVHGLGQNRYTWDLRQRSFANYLVAHGYEVFLADLRGHGLSRAYGAPYPESFEAYVEQDVPALLRQTLALSGHSKAFLIGHSLGGTISYCVGPRLQSDLRGIISIAGPTHFGRGARFLPGLATALQAVGRLPLPIRPWRSLPYISVDLLGALLRRGLPLLDHPLSVMPFKLWYPRSIEPEILADQIRLGFDRTGLPIAQFLMRWGATGRFLSNCGTIDYGRSFEQISLPMFYIAAAQDAVVPPASMQGGFEQTASRDKTFRIFDSGSLARGWGHIDILCGKAAPRVVWPAVLEWLTQH